MAGRAVVSHARVASPAPWLALALVSSLACGGGDDAALGTTSQTPGSGGATAVGGAGGGTAGAAATAGVAGAPAGAAGNSAGAAGTGVGSCTAPSLADGPVAIESLDDTRLERPASLMLTAADASSAALVFHWTSWPGQTVTGIRTMPISMPFGPWPAGPLGPSFAVTPLMLSGPVVAAPGAGSGIAMLFGSFTSAGERRVEFARDVPAAGGAITSVPIGQPSPPGTSLRPLLVAKGRGASADEHLVAFERGGGGYSIDVAVVGAGGKVTTLPSFGCATGPLEVGALPTQTASVYRLVGSTGKACCSCSSGSAPGKPVELVTVRVGAIAEAAQSVAIGTAPIRTVALVPHGDGAWVVVARSADDGASTSIELGRVEDSGVTLPPAPLLVAPTGNTLGVALHQSGLALGWVEPGGPDSSVLQVRLVSSAGEVSGASSVPLPFARGASPVALASNPSGGGIVVALSHPSAVSAPLEPEERIAMLRLSWGCTK